ncbi:MAG: class I SAM-dependent methyltransferase [Candidatus Bathyarchaeota archaeon]|nr:class I SAM-dependent methyltransferase [Candidatus Bathyarchaeota archaeon]
MKDIIGLNKRAWDKLAEGYDDRTSQELSQTFVEFKRLLPENGKVLDLGCGTGLPHDRNLVDDGFRVVGVDLSGEMVKVATRNVPEAMFHRKSMDQIEYRGEFDGVFSSFSMLLLSPDLFRETAKRIYSSLVDGGYFFLALNEPVDVVEDAESEAFTNIMGQDMYSRAYTVDEIEMVFKPLGFTQISFNRVVHISEEFGEEHVIEFIYRK